MKKFAYALLFLLGIPFASPSQIIINEISICNVNERLDPNYDYSGWIELYNTSSSDIELKNVYFSDEENNALKYKLSTSRTLPANGYAIVWLNGEVKNSNTGYSLDTDANDGGILTVSDKNGNIYDTFTYDVQYPNVSYGHAKDGDTSSPLVYFIDDTFEASNNNAKTSTEITDTPVFSLTSGFYDGSQSIEISCKTEGAEIHYTTDNEEPTKASPLYTGPITIDTTTILRAKAFKDGMLKGLIATNTYMIDTRKPTLPVVFLNTTNANLYDDMTGIYCVGLNGKVLTASNPKANYNQDWTRWANFELIDESRDINENQQVGIAISGNASRGYAQKAFKIKGKTKFGKNRFDFNLFERRQGLRYKSFLLRAGGQFYNNIPLIHDACIQSLCDVTPLAYQEYFPVVVYLNGKYWGIYNARERKNKDMIYSHYGLGETDIDIVEYSWRAVANTGTLTAWKEFENTLNSLDLSSDDNYAEICKKIDIDNYLYYMATEILIKNTDWPNNNQMMFNDHNGGKWRWVLQDLDKTIEKANHTNPLKSFIESTTSLSSTKLIVSLLENAKFKEQYITTQALVAGSVYSPNRFSSYYNKAKERIESEYSYHKEKWAEQAKNDLNKTSANIVKIEAALCSDVFLNLQENFSLGTIHALTIKSGQENTPVTFNGQLIPALPYEGSWFEGKSLTLTAPLYLQGKKFSHWAINEDGNTRTVITTALHINITKDTQIEPVYNQADLVRREGLYINEVSADNAIYVDNFYKYEDWIEIYNSSTQPIDLAEYYLSTKIDKLASFQFTDTDKEATSVNPGEHKIIWCSKKTERGPLHANFKLPKEGSSIYLSKEDNSGKIAIVDSINYVQHSEFKSVGRYPDACETIVTFDRPTFANTNQFSTYNIENYIEDYNLVSEVRQIAKDSTMPLVYLDNAHSLLNIIWKDNIDIRIITPSGIMVKQENSIPQAHTINISDLTTGVYLIILESDTERHALKFFK